ncbi:hypothetical protein [Carboxylicivirga linearis]|uniref:Uncharacterized protein n=1 Tax=Carboxylicivirga linearis TaxID=1628157 RepID=A0ABS5JXJ5_9BACT|nr:hypothetical protein [Carboxylicivirga linearis]MBS2099614.1 hypothetical protein [Carboxylicivirga linearis]
MVKKDLNDLKNLTDKELLDLIEDTRVKQGDLIIRLKRELKLRKELEKLSNPVSFSKQQNEPNKKTNYLKLSISLLIISSIVSYYTFRDPNAEYSKRTIGTINELVELTTYSQSFRGMSHILLGYIAKYNYQVDSINYGGQTFIKSNVKNSHRIKEIKKNLGVKKFVIRYKDNEPDRSVLDLDKIILDD